MVTPKVARWVPAAHLMAAGLALAAIGNFMLAQIDGGTSLWVLVAGTVIVGLGLSPMFTLANDLIIGSAPPERAGAASGISETGAELGIALSIVPTNTPSRTVSPTETLRHVGERSESGRPV